MSSDASASRTYVCKGTCFLLRTPFHMFSLILRTSVMLHEQLERRRVRGEDAPACPLDEFNPITKSTLWAGLHELE